ncbi:mitochondrial ribosomal small subunit component [Thoreauomyces humboldtii]|nr:mitochondrial ribosomal small subunit component [Thoreauomyces humboldtii]
MAPPLRNNPYTLCKNIDRLTAAGRVRNLPAWYKAVSLYPTTQFTPKGVVPSEIGQFQPPTAAAAATMTSSPREYYKRINPRTYKAQYVARVPEIVYPEDELRQAFYRWHPLELSRPRSLVETEHTLTHKDWSSIHGGRDPTGLHVKVPVTGESVVQHTLYLMSRKVNPLSRHQAYQQALQAFYKARSEMDTEAAKIRAAAWKAAEVAAQEEAAEAKRQADEEALREIDPTADAEATTAQLGPQNDSPEVEQVKRDALYWARRPLSARFNEWESAELADSKVFEDQQRAARSAQEEMRRKMEQYEKRNIVSEETAEPE